MSHRATMASMSQRDPTRLLGEKRVVSVEHGEEGTAA